MGGDDQSMRNQAVRVQMELKHEGGPAWVEAEEAASWEALTSSAALHSVPFYCHLSDQFIRSLLKELNLNTGATWFW